MANDRRYLLVKNMINIISSKDILKNQDTTRFDKECEYMMKRIQEASKRGERNTCFIAYEFEPQVKEVFRKKGYTFKPTGYLNGVWQMTEDICW